MSIQISYNDFPNKEKVWAWQQEIHRFGPRLTGNNAHKQLIDYFETELTQMGLEVHRDKHTFTKWEAKHWNLSVQGEDGNFNEMPVTFYYPYSGKTTVDGVIGELIYCGKGAGNFKQAAGKIAIVEVAVFGMPTALLFKRRSSYPKNERISFTTRNPVISSVLRSPNLEKAEQAGVLGVICVWKNISDDNAQGQYLPFTTAHKNCPSLWVGGKTGDMLKKLALRQAKARLVLHAEIEENADSDTLYAVLPGTNKTENILINTHTDGPNAWEENGGVGLLAMAKYFSSIPLERRNRSIVFVFVTGHFQIPQFGIHGQATTRWLNDHPELWNGEDEHQLTVAGITLEHLGCKEWKENKDHSGYAYSGNLELEIVYTANAVLDQIYMDCLQGRSKVRSITFKPKSNIYFGEGQPLYNAGIPTISLIPAPEYLCAIAQDGDLEKLDSDFLFEQIETFTKIAAMLDHIPRETIGKPEAPSKGILGLLIKE